MMWSRRSKGSTVANRWWNASCRHVHSPGLSFGQIFLWHCRNVCGRGLSQKGKIRVRLGHIVSTEIQQWYWH